MADKKRYEVVRGGPVGGHAPGEKFEHDPDDPALQAWVQSGAVKAVSSPVKVVKKDADDR